MTIHCGDVFPIELDGIEVSVQAIYSPDGGELWHCSREDRPSSNSMLVLSKEELLQILKKHSQLSVKPDCV